MAAGEKDPSALKTIGELSRELGVAQHILRYWETRFPQLKPMQRAGNRRYYRPADVALARRIHQLLDQDGYTVRGVQKLLADKRDDSGGGNTPEPVAAAPATIQPAAAEPAPSVAEPSAPAVDIFRLIDIRNRLAALIDS
ncbi:MAG: MerR family transcriptional regulator [Sphingomonas sp.]|nr:MerR family transcriptional regulator [Sphingomonas sp.]